MARRGACIDPAFGPTQANLYWSATSAAGTPSVAWFVYFSNGTAYNFGKAHTPYVRAVRGGF